MKDHFLRVAAATPAIRVADPEYNAGKIEALVREAAAEKAKIAVFPELCLTGCSCGDLFLNTALIEGAKRALLSLIGNTADLDILCAAGLPVEWNGHLIDASAVWHRGRLLGLIGKTGLSESRELSEKRYFSPGPKKPIPVRLKCGEKYQDTFLGSDILFACEDMPGLILAVASGMDLSRPDAPAVSHAKAGATVLLNPSADNELAGKREKRGSRISGESERLLCACVSANAGEGESTTDLVFSGHNLIAEKGDILAESAFLGGGIICADVDLERLRCERRQKDTLPAFSGNESDCVRVPFSLAKEELDLRRFIAPMPFVPQDPGKRSARCEEVFLLQAAGLKKRLEHIGCRNTVIGLSGGLDSTLALLVTAKAYDLLGLDRKGITAVTMPCFGTTGRTYRNACDLAAGIGATLKEVNIRESVSLHFRDIGQDPENHDVTYENAQARERTQVLMDLANQTGGLVVGTGDLSELALGWATYNGDHMSMYAVNGSVPKTLVRHLVAWYAGNIAGKIDQAGGRRDLAGKSDQAGGARELAEVLQDILDTPVSPELLPPADGEIAQKTEDIVGPYELHDFFLYYFLRYGYTPSHIYRLAKAAFAGSYPNETILHWLKTFFRRFFTQQFKRSCLPDGPKVGTVGVSPRGDLRMPSDASAALWRKEAEELTP